MSRRYRQSPVFYEPAPTRWPWALALLLVIAAVVFTAIMRPGIVPLGALNQLLPRGGPASQIAPSPDPEFAANATAAVESVPTEASTTEADVSPAPLAQAQSADEVAVEWVARWNAGDYAGMYALTSGTVRRTISPEEFSSRYQGIVERAELHSVRAEISSAAAATPRVPFRVTFESGIAGEFSEENTLPLVRDEDGWRVAWTPSTIFAELGTDGCVDVDRLPSGRGKILDRHGEPLAYDGEVQRVGIVPGLIPAEDQERVLRELSDLTGMDEEAIAARYEGADPSWFVPIMDFPREESERLLDIISRLPGVSVKSEMARVYPLGEQAAHITGYVSEPTAEQLEADPSLVAGQRIGQAGVEAGADDILAGVPGGRLIVVNCDSRVERSEIASRQPVPPRDVVLTIDRAFQSEVFAAMRSQGAVQGAAVILDPRNGAVLALASVPSYDPNGFVLGFAPRDRATLQSEAQRPLLSRAAEGLYPTGSAFKPITFTAAMEGLGYTPETVLDCPSTFQLEGARQVWEDWTVAYGVGAQGPLTLHQALVNSCNTIFYAIGRELDAMDPDYLPRMAKAFGLGAPTGIPYLPEAAGAAPDPEWKLETFGDYWATGDAVNLAIGQGFLQVTPLQLATAYAAIANGGDLLQPYIVSDLVDPDGAKEPTGERIVRGRLPVSSTTLAALQAALRAQTSDPNGAGSYRVFGDMAWPVAGKTGTAQVTGSATAKPHSWFAGFGPYGAEAEIASAVIFESVGEGVSYAAPMTRRIYEAWLQSDLRGS
ncbi:MAG: penicillin-binding protein 2 [Thermomicrobiales bacterium]|nr:penicillin-binding protein 2 [Thermomicrobiales bacterium]